MNSLALLSQSTHPPVLNFAGEEEEEEVVEDTSKKEVEEVTPNPAESQDDEPDASEEDAATPAGKKFAAMRQKLKQVEADNAAEREARIRAEAKAEAIAEYKHSQETVKPVVKEEIIPVNPNDEATVLNILRNQGIDINSLKNLKDISGKQQQIMVERQIDTACQTLEKKYAKSVPFDKEKVIAYAVTNRLGLAVPNAPLETVLEIAYKAMNEDALDTWKYEQRKKPKKDVPDISNKGTGKKEISEEKPTTVNEYRNLAKTLVGADE